MIFFMQLQYCANTIYDRNTIEDFNITTSEDNNIFQFENFNIEFNDAFQIAFENTSTRETSSVLKEQAIGRFKDYDEMLTSLETINFKLLDLDTIVDRIKFLEIKLDIFKSTSDYITYKKCNIIKRIRSRDTFLQLIDKTRDDIHSKFNIFVSYDKDNFLKVVKYFELTNFEKMFKIHEFFLEFVCFLSFFLSSSEAESKETVYIKKYKMHFHRLTQLYEDPNFVFEILHILDSFKFHLTNTIKKQHYKLISFYSHLQFYIEDFLIELKYTMDSVENYCNLTLKKQSMKKKGRKQLKRLQY